MFGARLLTAFNFKRAGLCVQGKSAEVHITHCGHGNPENKKKTSGFSKDAKHKCTMQKQTEKASASFRRIASFL